MLGTVTEVSQGELKVTLDDDPKRDLRINTQKYQHFDHGYAVTIHKSQGATVDKAYVLASRSMDHHLAYVAMTRHKSDLQLYLDQSDLPKWVQDRDQRDRTQEHQHHRTRAGPSLG